MIQRRFAWLCMLLVLAILLSIPPHKTSIAAAAAPAASTSIEMIGSLGGSIRTMAVSGNVAYINEGATLAVLDLSNPAQPVRRSFIQLPGPPDDLEVADGMAYALLDHEHIQIIDVRNPDRPLLRGSYKSSSYLFDLRVVGSMVYVLFDHYDRQFGFLRIDATDPDHPVGHGGFGMWHQSVTDLAIVGNLAYMTAYSEQDLKIIDLSDPAHPVVRGEYDTPGSAYSVAAVGQMVYIADQSQQDQLSIVDASNPSSPVLRGSYQATGMEIDEIEVIGSTAYLLDESNGYLRLVDVRNPASPTPLGAYQAADWIDKLVVTAAQAYIVTASTIETLDFSNPATPRVTGRYMGTGYVASVEVVGNIAYIFGDELQIFNMDDPARPQRLSRIEIPTRGYGKDLRVVDGTAYLLSDIGLHIVDVRDPDHPALLGRHEFSNTSALDVEVAGDLAYIVTSSALEIIDVTNPVKPIRRGSYPYAGDWVTRRDLQVVGSTLYFSFPTAIDKAELHIIDVHNPDSPRLRGKLVLGGSNNLHVVGNRAYITGYPFSVVDISNPEAPKLLKEYQQGATDVQIVGTLAYLTRFTPDPVKERGGTLEIIDLADLNNPQLQAQYVLPVDMDELVVVGDTVYVEMNGLRVFHVHSSRYTPNMFLPLTSW